MSNSRRHAVGATAMRLSARIPVRWTASILADAQCVSPPLTSFVEPRPLSLDAILDFSRNLATFTLETAFEAMTL